MRGSHAVLQVAVLALSACAPPAPQVEQPEPDAAVQAAYVDAVSELTRINREVEDLMRRGRREEAAQAITRGQPLQARLLDAPHPPLAAMQAISGLDDAYARVLLAKGHDGWARMLFQKNVARWKRWEPKTPEVARRLRQAEQGIAECDRRLSR